MVTWPGSVVISVTFRNRAFFNGARPSAILSARSIVALMALLSCC